MTIRMMTIDDYDAVYALWASLPGIGLHEGEDSREGIAYYLKRNPETCFVAENEHGETVGAVLCGNDGRRGYINHLAVREDWRGRGIGKALINACLAVLRREGIAQCGMMVFRGNETGNAFWDALGSRRREDILYRNLRTAEIS
ncbi:MAG: GNAT family N-acetyltransferase [Oscillospiraceae bacterium]|nr:GNAT family N-acetyltransferase [Oscillospiraceae bacterium]